MRPQIVASLVPRNSKAVRSAPDQLVRLLAVVVGGWRGGGGGFGQVGSGVGCVVLCCASPLYLDFVDFFIWF